MRIIDCGTTGINDIPITRRMGDLPIPKELGAAFAEVYGDVPLRPAQDAAIFDGNLLSDDRNALVATPTNSGKSLLAYLLLFGQALAKKRAVLIEPLRALANEKGEELRKLAEACRRQGGPAIGIHVSTGDYRTGDEFMHSPPNSGPNGKGCIVIATPERLDALSRNTQNREWFSNVSLVCLDEAHLLGDKHRGPVLELLMAFFRAQKSPPRLVLLSATIANADVVANWLAPCQVIGGMARTPALSKQVVWLDNGDDATELLLQQAAEILAEPKTSLVVFVYQTASAEALARKIAARLAGGAFNGKDLSSVMNVGVAWFHSRLSAATKASVIDAMLQGRVRVTVSTTALAMGVNLPATHVIVRDILFAGEGELDGTDLLQMIGRAGRGNTPGTGIVYVSGEAKAERIAGELREERTPDIVSQLLPDETQNWHERRGDADERADRVGNQLMGILARMGSPEERKGATLEEIRTRLSLTLGGSGFSDLRPLLDTLTLWKLFYLDPNTQEYKLTSLGQTASECYLPPWTAACFGQFFRDLLSADPTGGHIAKLKGIDFLILLGLVRDDVKLGGRLGEQLRSRVNAAMEGLPFSDKSYLYAKWMRNAPEELLGSARLGPAFSSKTADKISLRAAAVALFLFKLSHGERLDMLQGQFGDDVVELQEKLRDNCIWLLAGIERILDVKCFYYHLRENCGVAPEQTKSIEHAFHEASRQLFDLISSLKYRSALAGLIRGIRNVYPTAPRHPAEATLRDLERGGILSLKDLVGKTENDLIALGISAEFAKMITGYMARRLR